MEKSTMTEVTFLIALKLFFKFPFPSSHVTGIKLWNSRCRLGVGFYKTTVPFSHEAAQVIADCDYKMKAQSHVQESLKTDDVVW